MVALAPTGSHHRRHGFPSGWRFDLALLGLRPWGPARINQSVIDDD